uniref:Uncharacterized protein n=1 Tax=Candidatus Methanogaster sp. ANME-2c ERB4 TaxID=2759911 RepID=A0A7G9YAQ9_9EURY|nr:hypothetical protein DAFKAPGL_00002 [Methanosarcinales archaeon ANME-2c ERB4]QNO46052.1 hypothetical protein FINKGBGL_00002 [Methanosarcinales archaeon ANME-2c ERB4]
MTTTPHRRTRPEEGTSRLAEAYADETAAINPSEECKTDTNPEYDELDVFNAQLK